MTSPSRTPRDIDQLARGLHAEAVDSVSWQTLARMRAAARGASPARTAPPPARALGWGLGLAGAALLVVAVGLRLGPPAPDADAGRVAVDVEAGSATTDGYAGVLTALEEDPDFYLWLANTSVQPLALE